MKKCLYLIIFLLYGFSSSSIVFLKGDRPFGFSFSLFPKILIDELKQVLYVFAGAQMVQSSANFSISAFDIKNNFSVDKMRFIPLINEGAFVNGIAEANPLFGNYFSRVSEVIGSTYEPKMYPIVVPIGSSQVYILSDIELYFQKKNRLFASEELLDVNGNAGYICDIASGVDSFLALVMEKNTIFGDANSICNLYDYGIKEKIIPIPGSNNYLTTVTYSNPNISVFSNFSPQLCFLGENQVSLISNYLSAHGIQAINKKYIAVSGSGNNGIKAVSLFNEPILSSECESAVSGNNIVVSNYSNIPLYINLLSSLYTSTGLIYLVVQGGDSDQIKSRSTVYSVPIINYNSETDSSGLVGTLANVNSTPLLLFANNTIKKYQGMAFTEAPKNQGDLYTTTSIAARVGGGAIEAIGKDDITHTPVFSAVIKDCNTYKDTVFISSECDFPYAMGGIFYSQGLFNESGAIKNWTRWQRKNICTNVITQQYMPSLAACMALPQNGSNMPITVQCGESGIFLNHLNSMYTSLPCASSGIQKIIDIPWRHPGIGVDQVPGTNFNLSPSYLLAVGYNTVILQQTAQYNDFFSFGSAMTALSCQKGSAAGLIDKTTDTKVVTFSGGSLEAAGALFTGCLAYTDTDAWFVVAGEGGIFILMNEDGTGCGPDLLRGNFVGLTSQMSWFPLGNFGVVKKVVSDNGFIYALTAQSIYRISVSSQNFSKKSNCLSNCISSITNIPGSTEYSSFSDALFSNNVCILATSLGLFVNVPGSSIKIGEKIPLEKITLPESLGVAPLFLYPVTASGNQDDWGYDLSTQITANIYVLATSISNHNSKIYRLAVYGNDQYDGFTVKLIPNFFIQNIPTYYYNPNIELLSLATDGASLLAHGVYGNSILYRSYIGVINPFLRHGNINLKNEYNFFEIYSKSNMYCGFPTYISGSGAWMFAGKNGFQGMF